MPCPLASRCAEGHEGVLCQKCVNSTYYFSKDIARCTKCPSAGKGVGLFFAIVIIIGVLAAAIEFAFLRSPKIRAKWRKFQIILIGLGFMAKVKMVCCMPAR